ncbi:MAG: 23S rRNA (pseudouridine(1915)-N(3))-methyltransferase RlmH [Oligoflexia bacterium]|nr:23S rRNA (pseudouridine(1915)-N(3))-methyltransferase RlmH [Oligoflexia bacterium]
MRVLVYSFGKLKTPGLRDAADYYLKLARGWLPVEEIELKPISVPDKNPATRRQIQIREGEMLLERIGRDLSSRGVIALLDEGGKNRSTQEWAESVRRWERESVTEVAFCIGSSLGFSDAVRAKAALTLSLGGQTLPHELARVVLLEQIYRSWGVVRGHPYHNEGA